MNSPCRQLQIKTLSFWKFLFSSGYIHILTLSYIMSQYLIKLKGSEFDLNGCSQKQNSEAVIKVIRVKLTYVLYIMSLKKLFIYFFASVM